MTTTEREVYSGLRKEGRLHGTIKDAMEKRAARDARQHREPERPNTVAYRATIIPLPMDVRQKLHDRAREMHPRRRNWDSVIPDTTSETMWVEEVDHGRYSNSCTYHQLSYAPRFRCCGVCSPVHLVWWLGTATQRLRAPKGWRFGRDHLGLYLVRRWENRQHCRYHFRGDDLDSVSTLRASALRHERTQKEVARRERENRKRNRDWESHKAEALRLGVMVGLRDSRKAGNCAAGTRSWADRHGLDPRRYYPAEVVLRFANGHAYQVRRAVDAAISRTAEDLARGYCEVQ